MSYLDTIRESLDSKIGDAEEFLSRDGFDPADPAYVALNGEIETLKRSYEQAVEVHNTRQAAVRLGDSIARAETRERAKADNPQVPLSIGEQFIRSDVFQQYPGRGSSSRVVIDAEPMRTRALPMSTSGWAVAYTQPAPRDITPPKAATPLLDLLSPIPWDAEVIPYVVWEKIAGGAATVPEGTLKPSAEWKPTATSEQMETIAVTTEATRQLLNSPNAVRAKIDGFLTDEILRVAEEKAAAAIAAATLPTATGATLLQAIRKGMAAIQVQRFAPVAVLLNPDDYAELDIDVFSSTLNGPTVGQRFWGLTPVPSAAQPAGTAVVGDFRVAVERYVNRSVEVFITDSHADNFTKNIFTLLAETRELSVVVRPNALVEVSATP